MKQGMSVTGMSGLVRKLKAHPSLIVRTQESVLKQEARGLCVNYGRATAPGYGMGFDESKAEGMRKRVVAEVNRVFVTRDRSGRLYELVKRRSPQLAAAYWTAVKRKDVNGQRRILRDAGIAMESLSAETHQAARTGRHGSVPKNFQGETMVSQTQLRAFAKRKASLVGFAQAGWYAAAKGLGGRVRRNVVSETGKRGTEEIFPASVRKLARRFPGIGGARVLSAGSRSSVTVFSNVRHAGEAMPTGLRREAEERTEVSLGQALRKSVAEVNGRAFGAAG